MLAAVVAVGAVAVAAAVAAVVVAVAVAVVDAAAAVAAAAVKNNTSFNRLNVNHWFDLHLVASPAGKLNGWSIKPDTI